jgi:polysaccharide pyruvyl transferase
MAVKEYHWDQIPNYGDRLTPHLLSWFSGVETEWAPIEQADVVVIGSALEHIPAGWDGHVIGTGRILEDSELHTDKATVHAVRGPLSARGIKGDFALGDAGLLACDLVDVGTRDIEVGVVPHWSDTDLWNWQWLQALNPVLISPWDDPLTVVQMIGRCKKIVSSSLHGIIVADAFGIPRRTEPARRFTDDPREGSYFKFKDHDASVGVPLEFGVLQEPKRGAVQDRQSELYDAFNQFGASL